jgi:tRNA threonylcarbamoyladenosine modification (KEOPS) complex  Pcc1 subunit
MKYRMELVVRDPSAAACMAAEDIRSDRGHFTVHSQDDKTVIDIEAADATALRATFNSVIKLLMVYEKVSTLT